MKAATLESNLQRLSVSLSDSFHPPSPLLPPLFSPAVSPELLGVLSSIAAFMALMALFFLYLSNKLSVKGPDNLSHLSGYKNSQPGSQRSGQIGCTHGGCMFMALFQCYVTILVLFLCSDALSLKEPNGIKRRYKCFTLK